MFSLCSCSWKPQCHGRYISMSDHLGESSTHMSWLMLSVSGYSLKCACAFTHLQGGQGQRWTLRGASRYFSPSGEIYGSSLALKEGRLGT